VPCKNIKHVIPAAVSTALLVSGSGIAQTMSINLAVVSDFYGPATNYPTSSPIAKIISAFAAANPTYSVNVIQTGSSAQLENQITNSGNALNVDLILSGNSNVPFDLYNNYPTMIEGLPFDYAIGTLAFWSNNGNYHADSGYSTTTSYGGVGYVDPQKSPYGEATLEFVHNTLQTTTFPSTWISFTDIDAVFTAISQNIVNVGFVAQSAICSSGKYLSGGSSERVYPAGEFSSYSAPTTNSQFFHMNYAPIRYSAIRVNRLSSLPSYMPTGRDPGTENELNAFVNFLVSRNTLPILVAHCFSPP